MEKDTENLENPKKSSMMKLTKCCLSVWCVLFTVHVSEVMTSRHLGNAMALDPTDEKWRWSGGISRKMVDAYFTLLKKCRGVCYQQYKMVYNHVDNILPYTFSIVYGWEKFVADFIDTTYIYQLAIFWMAIEDPHIDRLIPVDVGCCTAPKALGSL